MKVGVYGLGRFGSLWARLLSRQFEVVAYTRSGYRHPPAGVEAVPLEQLARCDALFLCVAISALEEVLVGLREHIADDTTVFDTCSVKRYPLEAMVSLLPERVHIIGTHPMFGPDSAGQTPQGLPLVYCPVRAPEAIVEYWRDHFRRMGLDVLEMSPEEHDREAAYTQGITHIVGRLLERLSLRPSPIATLGYRKLLEITEQTCNDPYRLFLDLQRYNRFTGAMRDRLRTSFDQLIKEISQEPSE